jgi:Icc-related predicted phosphoesterase
VTRRISVQWPDPVPFRNRDGEPIHILALSDQMDPTLVDQRNRAGIGPIDFIVGCGDLSKEDLAFVADAINAPIVYIRGNHDTSELWAHSDCCPKAIQSTAVHRLAGVPLAGLGWPGPGGRHAIRSERGAWNQALGLAARRLGRPEPLIVFSHVPPFGAGDMTDGDYHRGFRGYRWLLDRLQPPLWLHGHTPLADLTEWQHRCGKTTVVNVTGAVLVQLWSPNSVPATPSCDPSTATEGRQPPG